MMRLVLEYFDMSLSALEEGANANKLISLPVRERIGRIKYVEEQQVMAEYNSIKEAMAKEINEIKQMKEDM